jgi:hypothetical protein
MLDVVHYLFEEDAVISSEAEFETKNSARDIIYETVYERKFAYSAKKNKDFDEYNDDYSSEPFDKKGNYVPPTKNYVKPYIPPTDFDPDASNPYSGVLRETPLG